MTTVVPLLKTKGCGEITPVPEAVVAPAMAQLRLVPEQLSLTVALTV